MPDTIVPRSIFSPPDINDVFGSSHTAPRPDMGRVFRTARARNKKWFNQEAWRVIARNLEPIQVLTELQELNKIYDSMEQRIAGHPYV